MLLFITGCCYGDCWLATAADGDVDDDDGGVILGQ